MKRRKLHVCMSILSQVSRIKHYLTLQMHIEMGDNVKTPTTITASRVQG